MTNEMPGEMHHRSCPRLQFWDAGEWQAPCQCPRGWPRKLREPYKLPDRDIRRMTDEQYWDGMADAQSY